MYNQCTTLNYFDFMNNTVMKKSLKTHENKTEFNKKTSQNDFKYALQSLLNVPLHKTFF